MEKLNNKKIEEMTKEELQTYVQTLTEKINTANSDIQKYNKRVSNIKKMIKDSEKDLRLANSTLKVLELEELINNSTSSEN
ncbi:hypothetical protein [Phocaeicola plebeius]|jgi:polyhydroxyalkanoate synthesis regulator phasin|uniref:hypothetical protein n=1 Tax=Phocaeicola plebeius TaxID=310297 RepID=UPI00266D8024|nr:hypothetical protein [Phocaeicola plebeius]